MRYLFITILLLQLYNAAKGQVVITGRVTSLDTKENLSGVTILLNNTKVTYKTSVDGTFSFSMKNADTVSFSHIGYDIQKKYIEPQNQHTNLSITLVPLNTLLKGITVFTGYQKLPKERVTGSFITIDQKLFNEQVGTTVIDRLPNIAGSINVDRKTANPGISIRGLSTIQGTKDPLIILDNFPYQGNINNLNPNDVENITILKDAAAASIWGSKAGNGVIVITTKKGKFNQPLKIALNSNITIGEEPNLFKIRQISSSDVIDVELMLYDKGVYNITNPASARIPVTPVISLLRKKTAGTIDPNFADAQINSWRDDDVRNEFKKHFYQHSFNQQYALNLSNGNDKVAWKTNVGYDNNKNELDNGYERINLNFQSIIKPIKKFEIVTNIIFTKSKSNNGKPSYGSISSASGELPAYTQFTDKSGNVIPLAKGYSLEYLESAGAGKLLDWKYYPLEDYKYVNSKIDLVDIMTDLNLNYQVTPNVTASVLYRFERQQSNSSVLNDTQSYFTRDLINNFTQISSTGAVTYKVPPGGILDLSNSVMPSHNARGQLNFNKEWLNHSINALIGTEFSQDKSSLNSYRTYGYDPAVLTFGQVDYTNRYPQFATGSLGTIPGNSSITEFTNRYVSSFFNGAYTYKQKYTISLSARKDGSNLFGVLPNNKFNPLGSLGVAWDISKESFFKPEWIPYLKLRATYGYSGNTDQTRTAFPTISYRGNSIYTLTPYAVMGSFANPELKWEKVGMLNLGIDFRFIKNRISGSLEYFHKDAKDLFGRAQIDYTGGAGESIVKNVASMKGQGIDAELNSINLDGHLKWTSQLNLSWYRDQITAYYISAINGSDYVGKAAPLISGIVGKPVYSIYAYRSTTLDPTNGDPQGYLNGMLSKDYTKIVSTGTKLNDLVYFGSATPSIFGNFRNTFSYRNLSVSVALTYKFGYFFRKQSINYNSLFNSRTGHSDFSLRWQKPGDELHTSVPSMVYPANSARDIFYNNSEATIAKGDHIRLQYVSFNYVLNKNTSKGLPFSTMNIYINANSLGLLWTANKDHIDPDYPENVIPPAKQIALGIRADF